MSLVEISIIVERNKYYDDVLAANGSTRSSRSTAEEKKWRSTRERHSRRKKEGVAAPRLAREAGP